MLREKFFRIAKRPLQVAAVFLVLGEAAQANVFGGPITDSEMALLPKYCNYTQTFPGSQKEPSVYEAYLQRYGVGWTHIHHYCWAMVGMNRFDRPGNTRMTKNTLATNAVSDINYVLKNAPENFVFRFELMTRQGKILIRNGMLKEARTVSDAVISQWPERADSYALAAELEVSSNRRGELAKLFEIARTKVKDPERLDQIRAVYQASGTQQR